MSIIVLRNDFTGWKWPNGDGKVTSAKTEIVGFNEFDMQ